MTISRDICTSWKYAARQSPQVASFYFHQLVLSPLKNAQHKTQTTEREDRKDELELRASTSDR